MKTFLAIKNLQAGANVVRRIYKTELILYNTYRVTHKSRHQNIIYICVDTFHIFQLVIIFPLSIFVLHWCNVIELSIFNATSQVPN
jgi:hypothetical protein